MMQLELGMALGVLLATAWGERGVCRSDYTRSWDKCRCAL
jgi:hypothetical protein